MVWVYHSPKYVVSSSLAVGVDSTLATTRLPLHIIFHTLLQSNIAYLFPNKSTTVVELLSDKLSKQSTLFAGSSTPLTFVVE